MEIKTMKLEAPMTFCLLKLFSSINLKVTRNTLFIFMKFAINHEMESSLKCRHDMDLFSLNVDGIVYCVNIWQLHFVQAINNNNSHHYIIGSSFFFLTSSTSQQQNEFDFSSSPWIFVLFSRLCVLHLFIALMFCCLNICWLFIFSVCSFYGRWVLRICCCSWSLNLYFWIMWWHIQSEVVCLVFVVFVNVKWVFSGSKQMKMIKLNNKNTQTKTVS